jgi:GntR family transcriptional regulator
MANPMYRQIAEDLRAQIASGDLAAGSQLPTELDLRGRYSASRNTVRDAVTLLATLGLVETRPGQGTFVVEQIDPFVTTLTGSLTGFGGGEGDLYRSEVQAGSRNSEVISRHERRFIDSHPWSIQTSYYPMEFADRGAERLRSARDIPEGTVKYLAEKLKIRQNGYRDWITVRAPNLTEADFFKISADGRIPVYEIFRTAFDEDGRPIRLTITIYPVDRTEFIINVGNASDVKVQENTGNQSS